MTPRRYQCGAAERTQNGYSLQLAPWCTINARGTDHGSKPLDPLVRSQRPGYGGNEIRHTRFCHALHVCIKRVMHGRQSARKVTGHPPTRPTSIHQPIFIRWKTPLPLGAHPMSLVPGRRLAHRTSNGMHAADARNSKEACRWRLADHGQAMLGVA